MNGMLSSLQRDCNQMIYAATLVSDRYSNLAELQLTTSCFLEFHISIYIFEPRNTQWPLVKRRSLTELAQSASEKPANRQDEVAEN